MAFHPQTGKSTHTGPEEAYDNRTAMIVMTALFFMCGFLATLNDILIPHLKLIFDLTYAEVMLTQFSFFSSFLIFAYPSGKLVERIGYQKTLVCGLFMMAIGALLFRPAAGVPSFVLFMGALVVLAGGITALQVSGNPYISLLGPPRTASSRLNLTQAFNSFGSTIAPSVGGALILGAGDPRTLEGVHQLSGSALQAFRMQQASYVKGPYIGIAATLLLLGCVVAVQKLPAGGAASFQPKQEEVRSIWSYRQLVLGIAAMFLYCGAEISIGSFLVSYLSQPNIGAMTPKAASGFVSIYWGGSMAGRFVGSVLLRRIKTGKLLGINAIVALCLVTTSIAAYGHVALWTILLVGIFNSIMFPSLFTLGIAGLGSLTGKASGILMSAAVGAAVIPVVQGALADRVGVHYSFIVPAFCYVYVAFYGLNGSNPKVQTEAPILPGTDPYARSHEADHAKPAIDAGMQIRHGLLGVDPDRQ
jgi:MFS transporter, FHS family, L-fucose permease